MEQVSFAFSKTEIMAPFRRLLSPKVPFEWNEKLDSAFKKGKQEIVEKVKEFNCLNLIESHAYRLIGARKALGSCYCRNTAGVPA